MHPCLRDVLEQKKREEEKKEQMRRWRANIESQQKINKILLLLAVIGVAVYFIYQQVINV